MSQGVPSLFSDLCSLYDHPRKVCFPAFSFCMLSQISLYLASFYFAIMFYACFVIQPDILEQLVVEMEHSVRTTGSYPGRYMTEFITETEMLSRLVTRSVIYCDYF